MIIGYKLKDLERDVIIKHLEHFNGNVTQVARALGVCDKTIYTKRIQYRRQGVPIEKLYPKKGKTT